MTKKTTSKFGNREFSRQHLELIRAHAEAFDDFEQVTNEMCEFIASRCLHLLPNLRPPKAN